MEFQKTLVRRSGIQVMFQSIKEYGPISKRELQAMTGFSWSRISEVTNQLLTEGYIVAGEKQVTAGRTADKLDINMDDNYCIGVDISSQNLLVLVTDMKGRAIEDFECRWDDWNQKQVLEKLFEILDKAVEKYSDKHIRGIGFAIQGVVDISGGVSVYIEGIEGWENIPLKAMMEERYHLNTVLAHDPDCLMKCEQSFGILHEHPSEDVLLVHFNMGVGIGMSIMTNGQLYLGHNGRAGELSYTILNVGSDEPCTQLRHYMNKNWETENTEQFCNYIARSVAIANSLFNPERIILHTIGCPYWEQLYRHVGKKLQGNSYDKDVKLQLSSLGRDAKAKGAACIVIDTIIESLV